MIREDPHRERHARRKVRRLVVAMVALAVLAVAVLTLSWPGLLQLPFAERGREAAEMPGNGVLVSAVSDQGVVTWTLGADHTRVVVPPPDPPEFDARPRFSPDGTKIAFLRWVSDSSLASLMVVNVDGTNLRALTGAESTLRRFDWAPSSQEIAFTADTDGGWAAFVVGIGPWERPRSVAAFPGSAFLSDVLWHPAGDQIIVHTPGDALVTVSRGGGQVVELVPGGPFGVGARDVSPDGRALAYTIVGGLHVMDLLTGVREGRIGEGVERSVEFSPDGTWFATTQAVEGGTQVFVRPPDAAPDEAIGIGPVIEESLWSLFSPDGSRMIVGDDSKNAWVVDVASGQFAPVVWPVEASADWQPVWP
jgi:WD40 repeat protein